MKLLEKFDNDTVVRHHLLCAALDLSESAVAKCVREGRLPKHDADRDGRIAGWKLGTLKAWNPRVGCRLTLLLTALQ